MPTIVALDETTDPTARLFGARLKRLRAAKGATQGQIAKMTGVTPTYISLVERGKANPTLDTMVRLADAVGVKVWDLVNPATDTAAS